MSFGLRFKSFENPLQLKLKTIKKFSTFTLLCLPNKKQFSNSNAAKLKDHLSLLDGFVVVQFQTFKSEEHFHSEMLLAHTSPTAPAFSTEISWIT